MPPKMMGPKIMLCRNPLPVPDHLDDRLQAAVALWQGLKRAENSMPFADDLAQSAVGRLHKAFLLKVFTKPERFRFEFVSAGLPEAAVGKFADETTPDAAFGYLRAQASVTVEAGEPTLLRLTETSSRELSRLLLPLWENGEVALLLGVVQG
ncbi:hypothetical protein ACQR1W_21030 [Bradyrhizobium sp. HKCCYLS1011]|uniref:hypothetical protein n=1 Tax=Bradyrhizobium sp. HKCCYLS1011 TaxID=3420733 RepID=UPI003EC1157C